MYLNLRKTSGLMKPSSDIWKQQFHLLSQPSHSLSTRHRLRDILLRIVWDLLAVVRLILALLVQVPINHSLLSLITSLRLAARARHRDSLRFKITGVKASSRSRVYLVRSSTYRLRTCCTPPALPLWCGPRSWSVRPRSMVMRIV